MNRRSRVFPKTRCCTNLPHCASSPRAITTGRRQFSILCLPPLPAWTGRRCPVSIRTTIRTRRNSSPWKRAAAHHDDAAAAFVLGYQYLVLGYNDAAAKAMKRVVDLKPTDLVAKQVLDVLTAKPPEESAATPPASEAAPAEQASPANQAAAGPSTDLVGQWRAERDGTVFDLSIDEKNQFTWKAAPKGKAPILLSGGLTTTSDMLILESKDQGSMVGRVTSGGPDQFQFVSTGGPPNDKGLTFRRQ